MRLGINSSPNEFIIQLDNINKKIQDGFLQKMEKNVRHIPVKVMLGNTTITEQQTFDPAQVQSYFQKITSGLTDWKIRDLTTTNNEDVRRIFTKYEIREGNYLLSGHISIQFHVLLYYKTDHRVVDAQKELSQIMDATKEKETKLADQSDQYILEKLKQMGYTDLDHEKLFNIFFENDQLREKIYSDIYKNADDDLQKASKRKQDLFDELDGLLIETYQTSPVLIDDARLVTGEEGFLCMFDLEYVKNNIREGLFDPKKIPDKIQTNIKNRLVQFENLI